MRKYQVAWEAIKSSPDNTTQLEADVALHARIINGVRKEKAKDLSWKFLLGEQGTRYRLREKIEGKLITFYLVEGSITDLINLI